MRPRTLLHIGNSLPLSFIVASTSLALAACDEGSPTSPISPSGVSFRSTSVRAAVVIRDQGCGLLDGDGGVVSADRDVTIATESTNQNTTLICRVKKVANSTGQAVHYDSETNPIFPGIECGIARPNAFVTTTDWTEAVSGSGNATLRCRFQV